MRQVLLGDVVAAARSALELPPREQPAAISGMMYRAHCADKVMKRRRRLHAQLGNGSLMAAAMPRPMAAEPFLSDCDYLDAIRLVLSVLAAWKQQQLARGGG
jgi:hypothetical protein